MPASHGQQKQREKQKKKREAARRKHASRPSLLDMSPAAILRQAALLPMGPCFINADFGEDNPAQPRLVSVLITRKAPGNIVVPALALCDRTCLGIKNAFVARPILEVELDPMVIRIGEAHEAGMMPCEPLLAQSVVYHALDYARSLGFEPHRDFPEPLFGPRPEVLLSTPLARPERPVYVAGPDDPVARIIERLDAAVGRGNYDFTVGAGALDLDDEDLDEEDDDELDEDEPGALLP